MRSAGVLLMATALVGALAMSGQAAEPPAKAPANAPGASPAVMRDAYPGLASGALTYARPAELPQGVLLKADDLSIGEKEVAEEVAKAPPDLQDQLKKNRFFVLEQMATRRLLVREAKAEAAKSGKELPSTEERLIIDYHVGGVAEKVQVADAEVAGFYAENKDMVGDAPLDQVKGAIHRYLLQQKQQEAITRYIETLGQRMPIEVSAAWVKEQAAAARDNPVDKARTSGRPTLVDFGAAGCRPCDMMSPILETLRKKYEGKVNVEFVHVREEQVLAARYGIQSIPVQVFFDRSGKEMFRHVGFFPQEEIERKLAEMGVR